MILEWNVSRTCFHEIRSLYILFIFCWWACWVFWMCGCVLLCIVLFMSLATGWQWEGSEGLLTSTVCEERLSPDGSCDKGVLEAGVSSCPWKWLWEWMEVIFFPHGVLVASWNQTLCLFTGHWRCTVWPNICRHLLMLVINSSQWSSRCVVGFSSELCSGQWSYSSPDSLYVHLALSTGKNLK